MSSCRTMRLVALWCFVSTFATFALSQQISLRNPKAPCGLYFTDSSRTQGHKVADLDETSIKAALDTMAASNSAQRLALVGVSPSQARSTLQSVREQLKTLGFEHVSVDVIRRLSSFISSETGLFVQEADGTARRISGEDPESILAALQNDPNAQDRQYLLVGVPYFSKANAKARVALESLGIANTTFVSPWSAYMQKAKREPIAAVSHALQSVRYFFPIREDFVPPTRAETRGAVQKILVPGLITFTVLLTQDQPLTVLIPVTLVNAANSFSTATFRSFLGNWWRRSKSFFPSQWLKNVIVSGFFTADLYWAGRGSVKALSEILSVAGWQNLLTGKWLSLLFQTIWRAPIGSAIYHWEAHRTKNASTAESLEVRQAGAALEKYISYVMTQFYVYSIISQNSVFNLVQAASGAIEIRGSTAPILETEQLLMGANYGHGAMAVVGVLAFLTMKSTKMIDKIADVALSFDKVELRATSALFHSWRWFKKDRKIDQELVGKTSN
jgi:hypothetical protein